MVKPGEEVCWANKENNIPVSGFFSVEPWKEKPENGLGFTSVADNSKAGFVGVSFVFLREPNVKPLKEVSDALVGLENTDVVVVAIGACASLFWPLVSAGRLLVAVLVVNFGGEKVKGAFVLGTVDPAGEAAAAGRENEKVGLLTVDDEEEGEAVVLAIDEKPKFVGVVAVVV